MAFQRSAADPMPTSIAPMLAQLASALPNDDLSYGYEFKWDGFRAMAFIDAGRLRILSRSGQDYTSRLPTLDGLGDAAGSRRRLVLDGELVALMEGGRIDFQELQNYIGPAGLRTGQPSEGLIAYLIFDLLYEKDRSLINRPYDQRRQRLEALDLSGSAWWVPPSYRGSGAEVQVESRRLGYEGVVAKRLDGLYRPGKRSRDWLKVKNSQSQEFIVVGWLPGEGTRAGRIGALLLGVYDRSPAKAGKSGEPQRLIYAGKVGTGFTQRTLDDLAKRLAPLRMDASSLGDVVAPIGAIFIRPEVTCEVAFWEWTRSGEIRHPSFKGLRQDKSTMEIVRETDANHQIAATGSGDEPSGPPHRLQLEAAPRGPSSFADPAAPTTNSPP
jgi:bifunctional non-homologous end joining protein LigD